MTTVHDPATARRNPLNVSARNRFSLVLGVARPPIRRSWERSHVEFPDHASVIPGTREPGLCGAGLLSGPEVSRRGSERQQDALTRWTAGLGGRREASPAYAPHGHRILDLVRYEARSNAFRAE